MPLTAKDAEQFVGKDESDPEGRAAQIAESANSYERWLESRSLEERVAPVTATVTDEDGNTETVTDTRPGNAHQAVSVPEGFKGHGSKKEEKKKEERKK